MNKQTAEDQLREIAQAAGKSMREIYSLVNQVYVDDEKLNSRIITAQQQQFANKQLKLQDSELSVRGLELILLQRKLNRIMWRAKQWDRIKSVFTFKTKKHEPGTGTK